MKPFIIGVAALLLYMMIFLFTHDLRENKYHLKDLKSVSEEVAATGTNYTDPLEYAQGRVVFNQTESKKAMDKQVKTMLKLDDNFNPLSNSYWTDQVTYKAYFLDDSNTSYPFNFVDPDTGFTKVIKEATIVVTVNAGKGRYMLPDLKNGSDNIRSAAQTWEGR